MNKVEITVDGGYKPSEVKVKVGEPVKLVFNRISDKGCLDQLNIPALNVKQQDLPLNEPQEFELDTSKAGEVDFACGMNAARTYLYNVYFNNNCNGNFSKTIPS